MRISSKAAYHLLDRFYVRRSLNELIKQDTSDDLLNASILFAKQGEDYGYLSVMDRDRDMMDKEFALFMGPGLDHPIVLKKDKDLTLLEFALLYKACNIHCNDFVHVVESTADNVKSDCEKRVKEFKKWAKTFKKEPNLVDEEEE